MSRSPDNDQPQMGPGETPAVSGYYDLTGERERSHGNRTSPPGGRSRLPPLPNEAGAMERVPSQASAGCAEQGKAEPAEHVELGPP